MTRYKRPRVWRAAVGVLLALAIVIVVVTFVPHAGTYGEWVAGVGAFAAAVVALRSANEARDIARQDRLSSARRDLIDRMGRFLTVVEADLRQVEGSGIFTPSQEGRGMAQTLWRYRGQLGTAWGAYGDEDVSVWLQDLLENGQLAPLMRSELREAIDKLQFEDGL